MELVFFTLYNGRFHPFAKIIMPDADESIDLGQAKSSFWTDKFNFLRVWNNIKNSVHMTADRPKKFYNQTQDINNFSKNTVVNGERDFKLKVISEHQSLDKIYFENDKDMDESRMIAQNIVSNLIESLDLCDEIPHVTTEQPHSLNHKNDQKVVENVQINNYECIEDKQMKEWHFPILTVVMILLFGLFTGMAVFFGLGLNVQIGKSLFYLK